MTHKATNETVTGEVPMTDTERLNFLDTICTPYYSGACHEGNGWGVAGPFANVRDAIDQLKKLEKV